VKVERSRLPSLRERSRFSRRGTVDRVGCVSRDSITPKSS